MENSMSDKKVIRQLILETRNRMSEAERQEKSRKIMSMVKQQKEYQTCRLLFAYASFGSEVITRELIREALSEGKRIALPRAFISAGEPCMEFYEITEDSQLTTGFKGILEPNVFHKCVHKTVEPPDLMLMPGVAFDKSRNRIGYGKGFYDRYLQGHPGIRTIAVAYACQVVAMIPASAYDYRPDRLFTEERIY